MFPFCPVWWSNLPHLLPQPTNYYSMFMFFLKIHVLFYMFTSTLLYISFLFLFSAPIIILKSDSNMFILKFIFYNYCFYYQVISKIGDLIGIKYFPVETQKHKIEWGIRKQRLNCWKSFWPSVLYTTMLTLELLGQALLEISSVQTSLGNWCITILLTYKVWCIDGKWLNFCSNNDYKFVRLCSGGRHANIANKTGSKYTSACRHFGGIRSEAHTKTNKHCSQTWHKFSEYVPGHVCPMNSLCHCHIILGQQVEKICPHFALYQGVFGNWKDRDGFTHALSKIYYPRPSN